MSTFFKHIGEKYKSEHLKTVNRPPIRFLVQAVQKHPLKDLARLQGVSECDNIKLTLSLFLVFTSIFSGVLQGLVMVLFQLAINIASYDKSFLINGWWWLFSALALIFVALNFMNLTKT